MEKPVFVINGFLDSGKTSFIRDTLNDPQFLASGKVLLILCEEGEEEYDEVELSKKGVSIICIAMDAPADIINALTGKIGRLPGVTYSAVAPLS